MAWVEAAADASLQLDGGLRTGWGAGQVAWVAEAADISSLAVDRHTSLVVPLAWAALEVVHPWEIADPWQRHPLLEAIGWVGQIVHLISCHE